MNTTQEFADNNNLIDELHDFSKENWKTLLVFALLGMGVGAVTAFSLPEKFEATAAIQSGTVLKVPIEDIGGLLARMKIPSYYSDGTIAACGSDNVASQVSPRAVRNSALVLISHRAVTPELAKRCLEAVLSDVRKNQETDLQLSLKAIKEEISLAKDTLVKREKFIEDLGRVVVNFKDSKIEVLPFFLLIYQDKQDEIEALGKQIFEITLNSTAPHTGHAAFAAPIHSPNNPVEPKRVVITVMSTLGAVFIGVLSIFFRRRYRNRMMRTRGSQI